MIYYNSGCQSGFLEMEDAAQQSIARSRTSEPLPSECFMSLTSSVASEQVI